MFRTRRLIIFLLLTVWLCNPLTAGAYYHSINIENYIYKLEQESVLAVFRDSKGFLWIGTYIGLYRSDGTIIKIFTPDSEQSNFINSSIVYCIYEDSKGRLWMGTQRGLVQYEYSTESFIHHIPTQAAEYNTLKEIRDISEDSLGNLWLATYNHHGLIKYNPDTKQEEIFWIPDIEEHRINTVEVRKNRVWIGTELNGLFVLDLKSNEISSIISNYNTEPLTVNDIKIIDDRLYGGTWNHGLFSYDIERNNFTWHHFNTSYALDFTGRNIRQIHIGKENTLWLAVYGGGINSFNTESKEVKVFFDKRDKTEYSQGLLSWSIHIDTENILWLGTMETGLKKIYLNTNKHKYLTYRDATIETITNINQAIQDKDERLWIASNRQGLIKYDLLKKQGRKIALLPNQSELAVFSLMIDSLSRLWAATENGIFVIDPQTDEVLSHLTLKNSFLSSVVHPVHLMYSDHEGDVWLSAWQSGMVHIPFNQLNNIKPIDYKPLRYLEADAESHGLLNNNTINVIQTFDSIVWISGTYFIQQFSKKTGKFNTYANYDGTIMTEDTRNNLWIFSNTMGLTVLDLKSGGINYLGEQYPNKTGVVDLLVDSSSIWLFEKNELIGYNLNSKSTSYFKTDAGIKSMTYSTGLVLANNAFFLGGVEGGYIFDPDKVNATPKPVVRMANLLIYNSVIKTNDTISGVVVLNNNLDNEEEIIIPAGVKSFSIELSSVDFVSPEDAIYAYKLDGFDKDWTFLEYPQRTIVFTNLDGGNYTLYMARVHPFSDWKSNPKSLSIRILIPFYKTRWFQSVGIVSVLLLLISVFMLRHYRLKKLNTELENKVSKRTSELRETNENLIAQTERLNRMNSELIQQQAFINQQTNEIKNQKYILEKNNTQLNELVATKDKFFSIIAHDLKGPFNSILGFLEIMERNYDTQDDKTRKEMLNNALNSSKAIYELTDNLLFWARVENGSLKLTMKSINLIELLKTNVKVASILSKEKNITIDLKNSEELITMDGDVNMLNFVLRNLLSNSIKFTPNKGLIEVSVKQSENEIEFCVRDTGVGIPEDMIENLFKIDKAFTTPGTNKEKGTGLGLILCHDFIARHNGAIRVESKLNAGSSFYVLLPRYQKIKDKR